MAVATRRRRMKLQLFIGLFSFVIAAVPYFSTSSVHAAVGINKAINFQGKLTNPNGTNIANGSYTFVFSLYSVTTGGTAIWTETDSLALTDGIFQVNLGPSAAGANTNFGNVDFNSDSLYLGIKVGADAEMSPRVQFTATPYAFNSEKLGGIAASGFAQLNPASAQAGSLNIGTNVQAGSALQAPLVDTATAVALNIGTATASSVTLGRPGAATTIQGSATSTIAVGTGANIITLAFAAPSGASTLTFPNGTGTICTTVASTCSATYQTTGVSAAYLQRNTIDTSAASIAAAGYLYAFSNSNATPTTGGVLSLSNGANTGNTLSVTASGTVASSTNALIVANNSAGTGNLIALQAAGVNKFTVDTTGAVTTGSTINSQTISSSASFTGTVSAATSFISSLVQSADTATASTNSTGITFRSGNASGTTSTSGNVSVDSGTATGTTGSVNIGTSNASSVAIGKTGVVTTHNGTNQIGATAGTGALVNNGSTVNKDLALTNFLTGGSIGSNTATVDIYTYISISQTTAGQTITLPTPTANTTFGRLLYITNVGNASFILLNANLSPGSTAALVWANTNGAASWTYAGSDASGLQSAYNNSGATDPQIQLSNTNGGIKVRDASGSSIGNLLQVTDSTGTIAYLAVTSAAATVSGNIFLAKEVNRTIAVNDTTTAATVGANLTVKAAAGNTSGIGGTLALLGGAGGNIAAGGQISLTGGAAGGGNTNGGLATVQGGAASGTGIGGGVSVQGGVASATAGSLGGAVTIAGGAGSTTGLGAAGSAVSIAGGAAGGTGDNNGGNITLNGGAKTGAGTKGVVVLQSAGGNVGIGLGAPSYPLDVSGYAQFYDQTPTTGITTLYVQAAAGQVTNDLLVLRNNAGATTGGFNSSGNPFVVNGAFRSTVQPAALSANRTVSLPDSSGQVCLDSGNCNGAGATLQSSYNNSTGSTTPEIKLDPTRSSLDIQDANTTIAANLVNIRASNSSGLGNVLFSVGNTGTLVVSNSTGSQILSADASTLAVSINNILQTAAVATASTPTNNLSVLTGNATGTGAASNSGDLRIDTGTSTNGTAGVVKIGDNNASSIILGRATLGVLIPSASSLTLGTASSKVGAVLYKNATNANTLTVQSAATTSNLTLTLPAADGASGDCLTTNGTGALSFGSCTSGIGTLAANTSLSNLANVAINTSLLPGTLVTADLGSASKPFEFLYLFGAGLSPTTANFKFTGTPTAAQTITFPDATGTVCLTTGNCSGTSATLQSVYTTSVGGTTPEIRLDSVRTAIDIQDANTTLGSTANLLVVRAANSGGLGANLFSVNASGQVGINVGTSTPSADITFGEAATRVINVLTRSSNLAGNNLTIQAGQAGAGGTALAGGALLLQGGNAAGTTGNANGGNVTLFGGTKINSGTSGNVILAHTGSAIQGKVGIGVANPTAQLDVAGTAEEARFGGVGTSGIASQSFATFYDSNATTRIGSIGDFATSDSDFYVQADSGKNLQLGAGAVTMLTLNAGANVVVGSATTDATQVNLQVDSSSTFADSGTCTSTTNQGSIYYNTSSHAFRSCADGNWNDLVTGQDIGLFIFGVVPISGTNPGDLPSLTTAGVSGPCKVSWASSSTVNIQACVAYSGGRRVKVSSTTLTVTTTGTNIWQHICLNGAGSQPALTTAAATPTANMPTFSLTAPVLCLADIKNITALPNNIAAIYDVRTFTTTVKDTVTASTAAELGMIVDINGSNVIPAVAASQKLYGIVVATDGGTSTTTPNAIIAIVGPSFGKSIAGTVGDFLKTSTTNGYANTIAAIPNNAFYYSGGNARSPYTLNATQPTSCSAATNCSGSMYVNLVVR